MQSSKDSRYLRQVDIPLSELRAITASQLPIGLSSQSSNQRELISKHFIYVGERFKAVEIVVDRYYAKYVVLGDSRPYDVEITVVHERRTLEGDDFVYRIRGYDTRLAQTLVEQLKDALSKRREDRNIIDDFRAY